MTDWHSLSKEEIFHMLKSSDSGISEQESRARLEKYGKNEIKQVFKINPFFIFLEQFKSVFILILLLAALFSLFIKHYLDFSAIIAIVILNSAIGFFQQYKAEKTISEMKSLLVPKVRVFRDSHLLEISASDIVLGDIIQISEGDKIMADARILHVSGELELNEAVLTGESFPQRKSSELLEAETELANRENMLYMGTTVVKGGCKAIVVSTGMSTEFGKIAGLVQRIKSEKTPLEKKLDEFSKKIALVVVVLAVAAIILGWLRGEELYNMFLTGIALAISVIPEGVPAVIAITLAFAIARMKKSNALVRKLPAAETLGRTTVICVDKTGTLTEEEMIVSKIYCNNEFFSLKNHDFFHENKKLKNPLKISGIKELLKIGIMCNNARIEKSSEGKIINILGDPTEKAFVVAADKAGLKKEEETEREPRILEYSFSSKRKLMSIVRKSKSTHISYVKGAPDILLKACNRELINGKEVHLTKKRKDELFRIYGSLASQGMRVLGFAFKRLPEKFNQETAETSLIFAGFQAIMDPPRKEVPDAIKACLEAGIKVKMITGDSLLTAEAVSRIIGLDGESIEEKELSKLSKSEFNDMVRLKTVFARITPETKLRIVHCLKEQGEIVAVTGDGVNDVLALKDAHIGVSMGIRGSEVAREVSDIILLDDNFASIVKAVREGRRVYDNLKKSITAHIAANVGEMFIVLFAILLAWPLPLLPLAILWMNLITDSLPTLSLSFEPLDKEAMKRKPIGKKETILTGLVGFLAISGILSIIITMSLFYFYFPENLEKARTIVLTSLVFCEMFIVISCRSERTLKEIGFFSNKFLVYSVLIAIGLQLLAVYTPLSRIFGFIPLSLFDLILIFASSSLILIFFEIKKYLAKNKRFTS